jgi:hypothetical protein
VRVKGERLIKGTRKVTIIGASRGITLPAHMQGYQVGSAVRLFELPGGDLHVVPVKAQRDGV